MEDKFMSSKKVEKLGPVVAFYRCRKRGLEDLLGIYLSTTFFLFNFLIIIKRHVSNFGTIQGRVLLALTFVNFGLSNLGIAVLVAILRLAKTF